jgi:uncharacterized membrane protein YuzA (DUF378 family)
MVNMMLSNLVLLCLVFVGALNWGLVAFNMNLVKSVDKTLNGLLGTKLPIEKVVYVLVAASAAYLISNRAVWLNVNHA